ncbi:MAG TPA: DoxX family protein [Acidimicrobiales bacterium]
MTIARHVTRPLLASIFIAGGVDTLRDPAPRADLAADVAATTADALPVELPKDPEALVKLDAAAKVLGGAMLAIGGRTARLGAAICAASLVPTTLAGHRFWEETDPEARAQQQIDFTKNVSIFGGLLIAALDTGGRPSVPWRAKRRAAKVRRTAAAHLPHGGPSPSTVGLAQAREVAVDFAHEHLAPLGHQVSARAIDLSGRASEAAAPERIGELAQDVAGKATQLYGRAADVATSPKARRLRRDLAHRAVDLYDRASDAAATARQSDLGQGLTDRASDLYGRATDLLPVAS